MLPVVRKMPEPITLPMASNVAPQRPMPRTKPASATGGETTVGAGGEETVTGFDTMARL
jgi:hypothetical protein